MALFKTRSAAVYGIDAHLIDVEVDMYASGSARDFVMVGMPDTAVRESRERIKSALINSGFGYPNKAVTINLAPANVRKEGAGFDLPMAMGILGAMGTVSRARPSHSAGRVVARWRHTAGARRAVGGRLRARPGHRQPGAAAGECGRGGGGGRRARVWRAPSGRGREADLAAGRVPAHVRRFAGVRPRVRRPGFPRRARTGQRQARARSRGGGRAQRADDRASRLRQDHAGQAAGGHPAAADVCRIHRDHQSPQRRRDCCPVARACCANGPSARRTTPSRMRA